MTLRPKSDTPGLFVDDKWKPGMTGTFAVIVGVSKYDHLDGSSAAYGLDQLFVSAFTACDVFRWLADTYRYSGAPVAKCWLLLSPSDAERAYAQEPANVGLAKTFAHAGEATLASIKAAVGEWYTAMLQLAPDDAAKSRCFFFFSGHGLEVTHERQILLPSDYGKPPVRLPNDAVSVQNIRSACSELGIRDQFFFLDACRNDHEELRGKDIRGVEILPPSELRRVKPNRNTSLMYASAAGTFAYAPTTPQNGASLFGRALVEGLRGRPQIRLQCSPSDCAIYLTALHTFVSDRVDELLAERKATVKQWIPLDSSLVKEPVVTFVAPRVDIQPRPGTPPSPPPDPLDGLPERVDEANHLRRISGPADWSDWSYRHDIFGSETMTAAWDEAEVVDFATQSSVAPEDYGISAVRRDDERRRYRITIEIPDGTYWLKIPIEREGARSAAAVLLASESPAQYSVDLYRDETGRIVRAEAAQAGSEESYDRLALALWRTYTTRSALVALRSNDAEALLSDIEGAPSFLSTIVLALVNLRARVPLSETLQFALRDAPVTSDAEILAVEAALQAGSEWRHSLVVAVVDAVNTLGFPVTSEGVSYLDRQLNEVLENDRREAWMEVSLRTRTRELRDRLRAILRYFRPGGLFTSFVAKNPAELTPKLVLPRIKPTIRSSNEGGPIQSFTIVPDSDDEQEELRLEM